MFGRLVVRPQYPLQPEHQLDLGALIEDAVFHGETELVMTAATIRQLTRAWGPDGIVEFLDGGVMHLRYQLNIAALPRTCGG